MESKRASYETVRKVIEGASRILISGHISPDGDSLGSMIALARLLNQAGYQAYASADVNALGKLRVLDKICELYTTIIRGTPVVVQLFLPGWCCGR